MNKLSMISVAVLICACTNTNQEPKQEQPQEDYSYVEQCPCSHDIYNAHDWDYSLYDVGADNYLHSTCAQCGLEREFLNDKQVKGEKKNQAIQCFKSPKTKQFDDYFLVTNTKGKFTYKHISKDELIDRK